MATKSNAEGVSDLSRITLKPGMVVKVYEKIKELSTKGELKERLQVFEGTVLAVNKTKTPSATFLIRKMSGGVGVEKIYPLYSPLVTKIELVKELRVRRAKLYYLRDYKKKQRERSK